MSLAIDDSPKQLLLKEWAFRNYSRGLYWIAALNVEVLRAEEGEVSLVCSSAGIQGRGERKIPPPLSPKKKNLPTSGIVRCYHHMRRSSDPAGIRARIALVGGEGSSMTTPRPTKCYMMRGGGEQRAISFPGRRSETVLRSDQARSPPTKANRVQSPARLPDLRKWESPAPSFLRRFMFTRRRNTLKVKAELKHGVRNFGSRVTAVAIAKGRLSPDSLDTKRVGDREELANTRVEMRWSAIVLKPHPDSYVQLRIFYQMG
ncbi:hypothetical protein PR048_031290 [Dryococelus australis]|uniref:Uncharacterized protein n=1 Tax=Dryococelus australis TaxID=614101 RepID=A0ABQ9G4U0_9NEOP|nr:hypothetical protein PR048_031290 [Dryococelus australis]